MTEQIVREYYRLFDETLKSGTVTVVIIALIILSLGGISRPAYAYSSASSSYKTANIMQSKHTKIIERITLDGVEYEIEFRKVK